MTSQRTSFHVMDLVAPLLVLLVCAGLYFPAASSLGLWEPWETAPASLARDMVEPEGDGAYISPFAVLRDGELIRRSWMQAALLKLGYAAGGGTEFGLRMPFAVLNLLTALGIYGLLRLLYPAWRAGLVAVAWAITPIVLLSSVNLAGHAWAHAPITLTLLAIAVVSTRPGRWANVLVPFIGLGIGLSVWAIGVPGFSIPVACMAAFAAGARSSSSEGPRALAVPMQVAAGLLGLVTVAGPLLWTWVTGLDLAAQLPPEEQVTGFMAVFGLGWETTRDVVAVSIACGAPVAALLAALPGSRVEWLTQSLWRLPLALSLMAAVIVPPLMALHATAVLQDLEAWPTVARAMLYGDFLVERTYPDHVTFDVLIRIVGFSAFPMVVLAPFGFGYLFHANDDRNEPPADLAFRMFTGVWLAVGFAVFGLMATLSRQYTFVLTLPLVAAPVLALTDPAFLRLHSRNRTAWYAAALACFAILQVMKKDIQGNWDKEAGQAGPLVIFELLLADGSEQFPETYTFERVRVFVWLWRLTLLAMFVRPIVLLASSLSNFHEWATTASRPSVAERERVASVVPRLAGSALGLLPPLRRVSDGLIQAWQRVFGATSSSSVGAVVFVGAALLWSSHLVLVDLPSMTDHFSQKGVLDTWRAAAENDEPLHTAGIPDDDHSYYLGGDDIVALDDMADIRTLFCESGEGRAFVVVPAPRLSEAYWQVKRALGDSEDAECPPQTISVLYGRSSRYALIANGHRPDAGERNEGALAESIFTMDTLPATAQRLEVPVSADGKVELVASEIIPESPNGRGEVEIVTYWRVLEPPPSGYEAFIHVDHGGNRINGDHDLVGGAFPMNHWIPGEIVRDSHTVEVSRADKSGTYTVYFGFYRGDDRLAISGPEERVGGDNRVVVGTLRVQ